jgi:hypothetical protein
MVSTTTSLIRDISLCSFAQDLTSKTLSLGYQDKHFSYKYTNQAGTVAKPFYEYVDTHTQIILQTNMLQPSYMRQFIFFRNSSAALFSSAH